MTKVDPYQEYMLDDIHRWVTMYENRANKDPEKYGDLYEFLQNFETFSKEYCEYFEQEVIDREVFDPKETTPEHIRYQALQTILEEWAVISRLAEQRELQRYETWLTMADSMAREYLPPGMPGVVAYLGKANVIRHNLYSAVSVASIPRDQYGGEDWMAGPHEIGHHVFWNLENLEGLPEKHKELGDGARKIGESVGDAQGLTPEQGQYLADLMDSWLQETFADVYGTLVAGDGFPRSIIKILKRQIGQAKDLFIDDGDHPIPYLRPLTRIKVLELKGHDASALRDSWKDFVDSLGADIHPNGDLQIEFSIVPDQLEALAQPAKGSSQLPLTAVETALYKVVEDLLLPVAEQVQEAGIYYPAQDTPTFQTLKAHIERQAQEQGTEAYKLLLRPLSTISAETHAHDLYGYHFDPYSGQWILLWHKYEWHIH